LFQNSLLQLSAAAALHQTPPSSGPTYLPLVGVPSAVPNEQSHTTLLADKTDLLSPFTKDSKESPRPKELCSNVVSSTMKDEESKEDLVNLKVQNLKWNPFRSFGIYNFWFVSDGLLGSVKFFTFQADVFFQTRVSDTLFFVQPQKLKI
jgi:hypothetical protein